MAQKVDHKYRKRMVAAWVAAHGRLCAGWQCEPHIVSKDVPLHWDHIVPRSKGGQEYGPGQVLCKHCNEAKHNTDPREFTALVTATPTVNPLAELCL